MRDRAPPSVPSVPTPRDDDTDPNTAAELMADRLASLGTLVASVAHEVNNPIAYVLGSLGELERLTGAMREALLGYRGETGDAAAAADAEAKIEEAGGLEMLDELFSDSYEGALRIRDLVRDLLSLARPPERASALVNVHEILDSTLRLANRQIAPVATLDVRYQARQWIFGDRAQLGGMFLNLITNAVQACRPPDPDRHRIEVRTRDRPREVEIEFADTGVGIPTDQRKRVFSEFFTTKEPGQGTGLGLFISRRIVHEHGGWIGFRDRQGGGTIFTVRLPGQGADDNSNPEGSAEPS